MNDISRRTFVKAAAVGIPALASWNFGQSQPAAFQRMNVGTARVDVTPDKPRLCASGVSPDPPRAYAPLICRCMTLFDGKRRIAIVNYPFNALDVATPILRERCERELGIPPAYLILLATHNHQSPIQIVKTNWDYGHDLAEKIFVMIQNAIRNEEGPADLLFGNGYGYLSRSQLSAPPDYEIQLLKAVVGNRTVALLFNYPTHPQRGPRECMDRLIRASPWTSSNTTSPIPPQFTRTPAVAINIRLLRRARPICCSPAKLADMNWQKWYWELRTDL